MDSLQSRCGLRCALASLAALVLAGCGPKVDLGPAANAKMAGEIRTSFGVAASGEGSGGAAEPTGTGWGTLRGRFVFDGTAPTMPPYNVTKDQATCTIDGKPPLQEWLLVDSGTGGIKNVAIYLRDASRVHDSAKPGSDAAALRPEGMPVPVARLRPDRRPDARHQE